MRIRPASVEACAKRAKSIKRSLASEGVDAPLSRVQDVVGRMLGYRSWQELHVSSRLGGEPSPVDEECDAETLASRLSHQAGVLSRELGVPHDAALRIAGAVGLTARGTAPKDPAIAAEASWRSRLAAARRPDGFVTAEAAIWSPPAGRPDATMSLGDATLSAWISEAGTGPTGEGTVAFRFAAAAHVGGSLVGVLHGIGAGHPLRRGVASGLGSLGQPRYHGRDEAALQVLADAMVDAFGAVRGGRAHSGLARQVAAMGSIRSPSPTDGLLLPAAWETAAGRAPTDCGLALWKVTFRALCARRLGHGTVLVDPEPPQFADVPEATRRSRLDHRKAREKIFDHLTYLVDDTDVERVPDFVMTEAPRIVDGPRTVTSGSEPAPLAEHEWPTGYDLDWLFGQSSPLKVSPHPTFWLRMPSELSAVTVAFDTCLDTSAIGPGRPWIRMPSSWEFHFARGGTLALGDHDLADYTQDGVVPVPLKGADGAPLAVNPFTATMTVEDMIDVLATNCSLIFAGNPAQDGRTDDRVTVRRAGR